METWSTSAFEYIFHLWLRFHIPSTLPGSSNLLVIKELTSWPSSGEPTLRLTDHCIPLSGSAFLCVIQHWLLWVTHPHPRFLAIRRFLFADKVRVQLLHALFGSSLEAKDVSQFYIRRLEDYVGGSNGSGLAKEGASNSNASVSAVSAGGASTSVGSAAGTAAIIIGSGPHGSSGMAMASSACGTGAIGVGSAMTTFAGPVGDGVFTWLDAKRYIILFYRKSLKDLDGETMLRSRTAAVTAALSLRSPGTPLSDTPTSGNVNHQSPQHLTPSANRLSPGPSSSTSPTPSVASNRTSIVSTASSIHDVDKHSVDEGTVSSTHVGKADLNKASSVNIHSNGNAASSSPHASSTVVNAIGHPHTIMHPGPPVPHRRHDVKAHLLRSILWMTESDLKKDLHILLPYFAAVFSINVSTHSSLQISEAQQQSLTFICEHIVSFWQSCVLYHSSTLELEAYLRTLLFILETRLPRSPSFSPLSKIVARLLFISCVRMTAHDSFPLDKWVLLSKTLCTLTSFHDLVSEWSNAVLACTKVLATFYGKNGGVGDGSNSTSQGVNNTVAGTNTGMQSGGDGGEPPSAFAKRHVSLSSSFMRPHRSSSVHKGADDLDINASPSGNSLSTPRPRHESLSKASSTPRLAHAQRGLELNSRAEDSCSDCKDLDVFFCNLDNVNFSGSGHVISCWKNLLGVLGNISLIPDPLNQVLAVKALQEVYVKVREFAWQPYLPHFAPWIIDIAAGRGTSGPYTAGRPRGGAGVGSTSGSFSSSTGINTASGGGIGDDSSHANPSINSVPGASHGIASSSSSSSFSSTTASVVAGGAGSTTSHAHFAPANTLTEARAIAFQMLCEFALWSSVTQDIEFCQHFYLILIKALRDYLHKDLLFHAIKHCAGLFKRTLPGSAIVMLDVVEEKEDEDEEEAIP